MAKPKLKKDMVRLYTTPTCTYCHIVRNFLKEHNIPFEEIDVSKDPEMLKRMIQKTGQMSVPVTEIHGTMIVGFDREALKQALKLK